MSFHGFLTVQSRGTVALPPGLRKKYALDQPGAQVEITEREDGVIEVRPHIAVPAAQAYFWTKEWQDGEREVDEHVARGQVVRHETVEDFLADLDSDEPDEDPGVIVRWVGEEVVVPAAGPSEVVEPLNVAFEDAQVGTGR